MTPAGLQVAVPADAPRIAELMNAISTELFGEPELTVDEVRPWLTDEKLEVMLAGRDGRLIGYGDRWREEQRDRCWLDIRVLPGEAEAGDALLRELERRAEPDVDPGARAMTYVSSRDETMRGVVESAGFRSIRASYRMAVALDQPPDPEWPAGIEVSTYEEPDEPAVHAAHQEAFRDHWEHRDEPLEEWRRWLVELPGFDPTLWFVARDGDDVAGVSLCRTHFSGDSSHGFVSVLAVRAPWRRRGLGTALLEHSFAEMNRRGMTRASLGVDAENLTGAVALYERAGMTVERRSDCYEKVL